MHLANALSIDIQVNRNVDVQQVVFIHDPELLIMTAGLLVLTEGMLRALTFPASLATNAVAEFGPSCFTSYVSSSFPSHMIAKFNDNRLKGMAYRVIVCSTLPGRYEPCVP